MFIELVDALRCPRPHEPTWLVLSASEMRGRHVWRGLLGCPICREEYPIVDAVADFGDLSRRASETGARSAAAAPGAAAAGAPDPLRLAALLALTEPGGLVLLAGRYGDAAAALADLTSVTVLVADPGGPVPMRDDVSALRLDGRVLPLGDATLRGAAVDRDGRDALAARVTAVRPGGRVVAPAAVAPPAGVRELARDELEWVAEATGGGPTVPLRRAGPR